MEAAGASRRGRAQPRGETLEQISNAVVGVYREHFGKGPSSAKTYALDDVVICVLRDGLTTAERTLFERGRGDAVREMRAAFQDAIADTFTGVLEEITERRVVAFMSQAHIDPDLAIEVFFLDGPVASNGSHDTDGERSPGAVA
jgi:uncharacterized protein YbcI